MLAVLGFSTAVARAQTRAGAAGSRVPLYFEENQGQTAGEVRFLARVPGYTAYLTGRETVFQYRTGKPGQKDRKEAVVRMTLAGSTEPSSIQGGDRLPGIVNYLIGNDPSKWHTRIPTYSEVDYAGVYPGVDLVYRGAGRQLEFDFRVAPGADPNRIHLAYSGASKMHVNAAGDLVLDTDAGPAPFLKPVVYQEIDKKRVLVAANYRMLPSGEVGFQLGKYDHGRQLIIDPVAIGPSVAWATYLGSGDGDTFKGIAVEPTGQSFICGYTASSSYPSTHSFTPTGGAGFPAGYPAVGFVTALNAAGTGLLYSTFISGNKSSGISVGVNLNGIAVDSSGYAFVGGQTDDSTFPNVKAFSQGSSYPATKSAYADAAGVVLELSQDGSSLVYSAFLGGGDYDSINAIAIDPNDNAYVTGISAMQNSSDSTSHFTIAGNPIWGDFGQNELDAGFQDSFAAKIAPPTSGNATLTYSTVLGSANASVNETSGLAIAADSNGNAYIAGSTNGDIGDHGGTITTKHSMTNATLFSEYQPQAFVLELAPDGKSAVYLDYLGGNAPNSTYSPQTSASGIAVDSSFNAYVTGTTSASNLQTTTSPGYQTSARTAGTQTNGTYNSDGFVTIIAAGGGSFSFSTYLNGTTVATDGQGDYGYTSLTGIAVGTGGKFWVAGLAGTSNFPVIFPTYANAGNALVNTYPGGGATAVGFLTEFPSGGGTPNYSVFVGPQSYEVDGLATNGTDAWVMMADPSTNLATTGAYKTTNTNNALETIVRVQDAPGSGGVSTVSVTIASSPSGLSFTTSGTGCAPGSYTSSQTLTWTQGSSCTVAFTTPQAGASGTQYVFSQWENSSTSASRVITAPSSTATYTATFTTQYQLTVATTAGGSATPTSGNYYNSGTVVNLQATANTGYAFNGWTGSTVASPSSAATTITMNAAESVAANFIPKVTIASSPSALTFSVTGTGCSPATGLVSPQTLAWVPGSSCTVTFSTPQGSSGTQYVFTQWENSSTNASRSITAPSSPTTYTASFKTQYQLTTAASPNTEGSATPTTGTYYDSGTVVNLQATANAGYAFNGWTSSPGTVANASNAATTITMSAPESVTANFVPQVTIASSPSNLSFSVTGTGCSPGAGLIAPQTLAWAPGSSCTVTFAGTQAGATGTQYAFTQWENSSTNASRSITAPSSPTTYTASFNTQYQLTTAASPASASSVTPATGSYYNSGTVVNLNAPANTGYVFANWTGSVANSALAATTVTMNSPQTVTANFNVNVTVASSPSNLSFSVTGTGCSPATGLVSPQTLAWIPGSSCTVAFSTPQGGSGTQYLFAQWENSSTNASRSITAPSSPATYTASFKTQYQLTTAASPNTEGSATPTTGTYYDSGTVVNLQATANTGYAFNGWTGSGVANASSAATTITMNGQASVTANFVPQVTIASSPSNLTFSVTGTGCSPGAGLITPQTLAWAPGSSCTVTFAGTQAGAAGTQYVFAQWENSSTNASRSITAPSATATYTASFNTQYQLTTAASPAAGGSATPTTGNYYNSGTVVNLQATANSGYIFGSWTGSVANSALAATTVTMNSPQTVTANFNVNVTIASSPSNLTFIASGTGCSAGPGTTPQVLAWTPGSSCTVTFPTPQGISAGSQYAFNQWENGSTNPARGITAPSSPATYTGSFNTQYQLTTLASAGGSVTPASGGYYNSGSVVTLQANANSGYAFTSWTGSVANPSSASTTVTVSAPQTVAATFTQQYVLNLAVAPANGGSISGSVGTQAISCSATCSATGNAGSLVTLTATPAAGYSFTSWSACPIPSGTSCTATLSGTLGISATFTPAASLTYTQSALVLNRGTGNYSRTVTVTNNGAAISASAYVADGLPVGVSMLNASGTTDAAAPPAGSPYVELGPIGANSSVTATIQFSRTGTQAVTYTSRILGAGPR